MRIEEILEAIKKKSDPCWDGYKQLGMKNKSGKKVPNCIPEQECKDHISPSGVKTNMCPDDDDYDINYGKEGLVAKDRKDRNVDVKTGTVKESLEETYHGNEFFEQYGLIEAIFEEAEYQGRKVQLNKPMKGDVKKYKVYVKDQKTGNVKKVNFGDPNMEIKRDDPERRKAFRSRHGCGTPRASDKTKAGYWSCRMWSSKPVSKIIQGK